MQKYLGPGYLRRRQNRLYAFIGRYARQYASSRNMSDFAIEIALFQRDLAA